MRALLALLLAVLAAGCTAAQVDENPAGNGGGSAVPAQTSPAPVKPTVSARDDAFVIKLEDFAVTPTWVEASVGDKVVWRNLGGTHHSATADMDGLFHLDIQPGSEAAYTFTEAGTYGWHCAYHLDMKGTVRVS